MTMHPSFASGSSSLKACVRDSEDTIWLDVRFSLCSQVRVATQLKLAMRSKYADLGRQLISIVCVAMALDILVNCINWVRRNGEGCTAPLAGRHVVCFHSFIQTCLIASTAVGHLPRLLCWVNGSGNRTDLIQETWGRRCDVLIFTSSRSAESWKDVHDKHLNEADWFFKTSDDT